MFLRCRNTLSGHEASIPRDLVKTGAMPDWAPLKGAKPTALADEPVYHTTPEPADPAKPPEGVTPMARILCDGNTKVTFVLAIANIAAPLAATELGAGTAVDLQGLITPDGLNLGMSEATIDASVLASVAEYEEPGRYKITMDFTCQRDATALSDLAWTTLVRQQRGFIVIRRGPAAGGAYAAADKVEVYTVTVGKRMMQKPTKNTLATFIVHLYASGPDNDAATCAA
jgi:hypothetical protein